MFGVFFSILILVTFLSGCGEIVMRVRLTKRGSRDKIAWWRRGGDEVAATYEQLFPGSQLPLLRRFAFWLLIASSAALLVTVLWKSN